MILYNGPSMIDGSPIVAIATGWLSASQNSKTGPMTQVWILKADQSPVSAITTGDDKGICGDCKHRGTLGNRTCYVNVGKAPMTIYKKFLKGGYPQIQFHPLLQSAEEAYNALKVFGKDRVIRIGAYGDPLAVPVWVWNALTSEAKSWTGYTHLWRDSTVGHTLFMASVDSPDEQSIATSAGWRTFRVTSQGDSVKLNQEIGCPASAEAGYKTTCAQCLLCNGMRGSDQRKSIMIQAHGVLAGRI